MYFCQVWQGSLTRDGIDTTAKRLELLKAWELASRTNFVWRLRVFDMNSEVIQV
jgi:hypothetical protein